MTKFDPNTVAPVPQSHSQNTGKIFPTLFTGKHLPSTRQMAKNHQKIPQRQEKSRQKSHKTRTQDEYGHSSTDCCFCFHIHSIRLFSVCSQPHTARSARHTQKQVVVAQCGISTKIATKTMFQLSTVPFRAAE